MRKDRLVSEVLGEGAGLTPSDLINADLRTVIVGGYDRVEVDQLLERAADALERALQENRRLQKENEALREQLVQYKEMETTLRNALISSQKISETIVASAKSQAQALLEEARLERARARMKSDELPDALRQEIRALTEARDRLRADMAHLIRVHEALLEKIPRAERVLDKPEEDDSASSRAHFVSISDETEESGETRGSIRSTSDESKAEKNAETENAEESPFEKLD